MKYKMVCIDIDGTLLGNKKRISNVNREIIKRVHKRGVEVVVTTGRIYNNAAYFSQMLGVDSPVIAANGAIVRDQRTNNIIYYCDIPIEECMKILYVLNRYDVLYQFNTDDTIYCNNWLNKIGTEIYMTKQIYTENLNIKYEKIKTLEEWKKVFYRENGNIVKSIVVSPFKKTIIKLRKELNKIATISSFASGNYSLEINYKEVSKGRAVKALIESYGIKQEELICIGDNENDLSMVDFAGLGIAMKNAIPKLKEIADYITDTNNNDGVAKALQKFILNENN